MSVITYSWYVDDLADVMTLFDVQKVYRADNPTGPWTEITTPATRVPLVAGVTDYLFTDLAGSSSYYYTCAYFNSGTSEESDKADPVRGDMAGYVSVQDVRDEGFEDEDEFPNDRIEAAITKASNLIDRVTRRFFEPRELTIKLDGEGDDYQEFGHPLIALLELEIDGTTIENSDIVVYNRHLTQNLLEPDDRRWPKIEYKRDLTNNRSWFGIFTEGQQNIKVHGYFGYTELGPGDPVGETSEGSQVPLTYGDTPELIKQACLMLVMQYIYPLADGDGEEYRRRLDVVRMKNRDQEIEYNKDTSEALFGGNLTGDASVDRLLATFVAPSPMVSV